jgi:hypothetical protein
MDSVCLKVVLSCKGFVFVFFQHLDMSCMKKIESRKCNAYDIISRIVRFHKTSLFKDTKIAVELHVLLNYLLKSELFFKILSGFLPHFFS